MRRPPELLESCWVELEEVPSVEICESGSGHVELMVAVGGGRQKRRKMREENDGRRLSRPRPDYFPSLFPSNDRDRQEKKPINQPS